MSGHLRNKYKIAGPQTWELVRAAYLSGDAANVVAERYGVTVPAIRRRAWKEKWTKRDLAAALEARGIAPPPPPAAIDYVEQHIPRAVERQAAEAERQFELDALVEQIAAEEDAAGIAAALERRALAQASAAMVQGRSREAQALASMAEMMRKRASLAPPPMVVAPPAHANVFDETPYVTPEELERRALAQTSAALDRGNARDAKALLSVADQMRRRGQEEREMGARLDASLIDDENAQEAHVAEMFGLAAMLAGQMVHNPGSAGSGFTLLIKEWREINLGEGEEDALKRAEIIARAHQHHLNGDLLLNWPEELRLRADAEWQEKRMDIERGDHLRGRTVADWKERDERVRARMAAAQVKAFEEGG